MKASTILLFILLAAQVSGQWEHIKDLDSGYRTCLLADGETIYFANNYYGFLRSDNNGETWLRTNPDSKFDQIITCLLKVDTFLYAGTWSERTLYRSSDKGATWIQLSTPHNGGVIGLGVHKKKIFLSSDSIYRSSDWGETWVTASINVNPGHQFVSIGNSLFTVSSEAGAFRSTNAGDMWYWLPIAGPSGVNGTAMIAMGTKLLMGVGGHGIFRTTNYGQTWTRSDPFLGEDVTAFAAQKNQLFISWSYLGGITMSLDTGITWHHLNYGLNCIDVRNMVCNDKYLFIWANDGGFWRRPLSSLAVEQSPDELRQECSLYPNPVATTCTFEYTLKAPSLVALTIYDVLGRPVMHRIDDRQHGTHSLEIDARSLAAGIYYLVLTAEGRHISKVLQVRR